MDSVYTTTITTAAKARGITINVLDPLLPIFELSYNQKSVRCYNALTDNVGAATFHLAQDKGAANRFLKSKGIPVADQVVYTNIGEAVSFMQSHESIVVKPVSQWGGRGVSTHISSENDLKVALAFAHQFSDEIVLEECVTGIDWRLIFINFKYVCAIQRDHAKIIGNGSDTIRELIKKKNAMARKIDESNMIPIDRETTRSVESFGWNLYSIPENGQVVQVRRTSNYHTGGTVAIVTDDVFSHLIETGEKIARLFGIPVLGVDMLVDTSSKKFTIIELSPDLAISPPEGDIVVEAYLDYLFPESSRFASTESKETIEKATATIGHSSHKTSELRV